MDGLSEQQRLQEEAAIRERDRKREQEKEEQLRRMAEAQAEEERKRKEEEQRRIEEARLRKKQEEEWKRLGSDEIQDLPPVPPPTKDGDPNALDAWYLDDEVSAPALSTTSLKPGRKQNAPRVTMKDLRELGVVHFKINLSDFAVVKQILKERDYKHTDETKISQTSKDDTFLDRWFQEHYNDDENVRLCLDGSCYYDFRNKQDKWIRVQIKEGDLIVIPAGMYHRGCLDEDDFVSFFRSFRDHPKFMPINRADSRSDSSKTRLNYLMQLKKGDVATELGFRV